MLAVASVTATRPDVVRVALVQVLVVPVIDAIETIDAETDVPGDPHRAPATAPRLPVAQVGVIRTFSSATVVSTRLVVSSNDIDRIGLASAVAVPPWLRDLRVPSRCPNPSRSRNFPQRVV